MFSSEALKFSRQWALRFLVFYHVTGIFSEEIERRSRTAHCPESRLRKAQCIKAIAQSAPGRGNRNLDSAKTAQSRFGGVACANRKKKYFRRIRNPGIWFFSLLCH